MKQRTLVLIKPDSIVRGLSGKIISRFEQKNLKIVGLKMLCLNSDILQEHYSHLVDKPFFKSINDFMMRTPIIAICLEGDNVVDICRKICGITDSSNAHIGTIRGDMSISIERNLVHASDSDDNARVEVSCFFSNSEIYNYNHPLVDFI